MPSQTMYAGLAVSIIWMSDYTIIKYGDQSRGHTVSATGFADDSVHIVLSQSERDIVKEFDCIADAVDWLLLFVGECILRCETPLDFTEFNY